MMKHTCQLKDQSLIMEIILLIIAEALLIRFEDRSSMINALFTSDTNLSAPLHEVLSQAGIPYTLQGTLVTIHPLKGQEVDANVIVQASKVKGVVGADQLVCKINQFNFNIRMPF